MDKNDLLNAVHPCCVPNRTRQNSGVEISVGTVVPLFLFASDKSPEFVWLQPRCRFRRWISSAFNFLPNLFVAQSLQDLCDTLLLAFISNVIHRLCCLQEHPSPVNRFCDCLIPWGQRDDAQFLWEIRIAGRPNEELTWLFAPGSCEGSKPGLATIA